MVVLAFVAWVGMDGSRVAEDLATPWIGVKERIYVYAYQLWLVVFAIALTWANHPNRACRRHAKE